MKEEVLLYGSGGHAKVVMESLASEAKMVMGIFDDVPKEPSLKEVPMLGKYDFSQHPQAKVLVTIGNNKIRKIIAEKIKHAFGQTVHASCIISPGAQIDVGSMVLHGAVVQTDAQVGKHVILNTRSIVEHDCVVGDYVHLAPGAVLCGHVEVGEGTFIGANAVVAPMVKIGKWCQISAGSTVLENVPDATLVIGVPGQQVKTVS